MLKSFFDPNGAFARGMERVWSLIVLNVLWLVRSLPVATMGASCAALYQVLGKLIAGEDGHVARQFFRAWGENWKKATPVWLILLAVAALFLLARTLRRRMALEGDLVTAAGKKFRVEDIVRLDLRRWMINGLAHAALKPECGGGRIRLDGLTYGGFRKEDSPNNAEDFMKALLGRYHGEVVDYEETSREADLSSAGEES